MTTPRSEPWLGRLLRLPRLVRIGFAFLCAMSLTLALFPLVDEIYLRWFYAPQTVLLPSLISAGLGLMSYLAGWLLMVGQAGDDSGLRPRRALLWYLVISTLALLTAFLLLIQGLLSLD